MKVKLDDNGAGVIGDGGHAIYVLNDGSEKEIDIDALSGEYQTKMSDLTTENKDRRLTNTKLSKDFDAYKANYGDLDLEAAKAALASKDDFNKDNFVPKSQHEAIMLKSISDFETLKTTSERDYSLLKEEGRTERLKRAFGEAEIFKKLEGRFPSDAAQTLYRDRIKFDDNDDFYVVDENGMTIISDINIGKNADINEAMTKIISARSDYNALLPDSGGSGSGGGSNNSGNGGKKAHGVDRIALGIANRKK